MYARLLMSCSLLGAVACTTDADGTPVPISDDSTQRAAQALSGDESPDGGQQCHGRYYWTCKDNRTPQHPRGDLELIDTLVPHHQMAIEMADMEIQRGESAEVKAMAEKMKHDQSEEIAQLLAIRAELTGCTRVTKFPDPHMQRGMKTMMDMSGRELDLMFVEDMIPHHASALQFSHYALPRLKHPGLIEMAHHVIDAQAMEVGELHAMKVKLKAGMQHESDGGVSMGTPAPCTSDADCGMAKCVAHEGGSFCDVEEMTSH